MFKLELRGLISLLSIRNEEGLEKGIIQPQVNRNTKISGHVAANSVPAGSMWTHHGDAGFYPAYQKQCAAPAAYPIPHPTDQKSQCPR